MERPQDLKRRTQIAVVLIILFHVVGLTGFLIPSLRPLFLQLVPYHLLLMLVIIIASHRPLSARLVIFTLLIFLVSYWAEWIGVHQAWFFGHYVYGQTLGWKLSAIPLLISVNWFLLIYSSGVTMQRSRVKNKILRIIMGALLLVLLDLLIEPIAVRFNYWHWPQNQAPLKNYISWFVLSCGLLLAFEQFKFKKQVVAAPALLVAQFVFFAVLVCFL